MTGTSEICVLDKKVRLLQPDKGFRTSIDSVLLAAACPVKKGETVLDMGCGVGGVTFCVLHRVPQCRITGVDVQPDYLALARQNAQLNSADIEFIESDIRDYSPELCFGHIVCNPPFLERGRHIPSPEAGLATARGHQSENLALPDWIDAGYRNLKSGGSFSIIHRADMIDRIIQAFGQRFGAVEIIPFWPKEGIEAKRVILRAVKGRKSPAKIHNGLVLHGADGDYTAAAEQILRDGRPLFL